MKKYEGYENTEAFTGEFEIIQPGGYVCIIKQVKTEEKPYGELLRIAFDIYEGEHKDFYKRKLDKAKESNPDAKWQGMYYQTVKQDDLKYFKGFITAVENSNSGFKWNWDEKQLAGKLFGGIFGQEEYLNSNGESKLATKCMQIRSVENIKSGNFKIPDVKKLAGNKSSFSSDGFMTVDFTDDDLPFN